MLPDKALHGRKFGLGAYTVGYVRDLTHGTGIDTGLGFAVTADTHPSALDTDYGRGTPLSFQVYLRLRPSRMKGMNRQGMSMGSLPSVMPMPSSRISQTPPPPGVVITAVIAPAPPKAGAENKLTVLVTGPDGKPLAGAKVAASVAMTTMDMGTAHPVFSSMGNGHYEGKVVFSMAGPWRVTLTVTPSAKAKPVTKTLDYQAAP